MILLFLFLISAAALNLEVTMTRVYSFLFVQSLVYILISCSMAGIGFGTVLSYYLTGRRRERSLALSLTVPSLAFILLFAVNSIQSMLVPSLVLSFLIFMSLGIIQVHLFQEAGIKIGVLYAADLIGASAGALLSYFGMNIFGVVPLLYISVFLLTAGFIGIYFVFFPSHRRMRYASLAGAAVVLVIGYSLGLGTGMFPTRQWQKEITVALSQEQGNPRITETRWTAFGRVDLVETDNPFFKTMYIDGGAGTKMIQMDDGQVNPSVARTLLFNYMGGVPLLIVEEEDRRRAAVIGSGGGIDAVTLLLADYQQIDAVEINPEFIDIVKEQNSFTGNIYNNHPRINLHKDEGRSFLRGSGTEYDLILMGLPIIKSARSLSNHALTENYLFTVEAFTDYFASLRPGGFLVVIAHYPNELKRLFTNAVKSYQQEQGLSAAIATQHIAAIGQDRNPTLIIKKGVFSPSEITGLNSILANLPVRGSTNFVPFSGNGMEGIPLNQAMVDLSTGRISLEQFIEIHEEDISWVTDDSPFFYQMQQGLPLELKTVGIVITLVILLSLALYLFTLRKRRPAGGTAKQILLYCAFAAIGLGFMLVEIAVLQQFTIFWRYQSLSLAVVLATILVSSGLGSLLSNRVQTLRTFMIIIACVIAVQTLEAFILADLLRQLEQAASGLKLIITVAIIFPVFMGMGFAFPFLMRLIKRIGGDIDAYPWMMGINSFTTLAGGVAALSIAMLAGYKIVFFTGIAAYAALLIIIAALGRHETIKQDSIHVGTSQKD